MSRSRAVRERAPPLAYGDRIVTDYLPEAVLTEGRLLSLRTPEDVPAIADVDGALRHALEVSATPEALPSLEELMRTRYRRGDVTIIVDDYTRPCVHQRRLLPGLLLWLLDHRVRRERVNLLVSTATHRDPRPEEYPHIFGDAVWPAWRDRVFSHHDREDLERLGTMPDGTPVELNGKAARSEVIISLSDLDYHYFAGVTGGPKHLVPGIAGRALTTADHLQMFGDVGFAPNVDMGMLDGNPVYEYKRVAVGIILDALTTRGAFVYALICVLNPRHQFVALEGGGILALHRKLRTILDRVYVATVPARADIVIVSARHLGINVYQAGKAINTAVRAVKPGGTVVCLAPCPDGFGNDEFRNLMGIAAPFLREAGSRISDGANLATEGDRAIEGALRAVQAAVVTDFRIGKQKPVDLLGQYLKVGWGNLWLLCDGLAEADRALLPFRYVGLSGGDPAERLRSWVAEREARRPTYLVLDDPMYWVRVDEPR